MKYLFLLFEKIKDVFSASVKKVKDWLSPWFKMINDWLRKDDYKNFKNLFLIFSIVVFVFSALSFKSDVIMCDVHFILTIIISFVAIVAFLVSLFTAKIKKEKLKIFIPLFFLTLSFFMVFTPLWLDEEEYGVYSYGFVFALFLSFILCLSYLIFLMILNSKLKLDLGFSFLILVIYLIFLLCPGFSYWNDFDDKRKDYLFNKEPYRRVIGLKLETKTCEGSVKTLYMVKLEGKGWIAFDPDKNPSIRNIGEGNKIKYLDEKHCYIK